MVKRRTCVISNFLTFGVLALAFCFLKAPSSQPHDGIVQTALVEGRVALETAEENLAEERKALVTAEKRLVEERAAHETAQKQLAEEKAALDTTEKQLAEVRRWCSHVGFICMWL